MLQMIVILPRQWLVFGSFYNFFMEFINIGPVYIRGWVGGAWGGVGGGKSLIKEERRQIVESRVAMTCTCTHKEPILYYKA